MTSKPTSLDWREWHAAKIAGHLEEEDRHRVHREALSGNPQFSSKLFNNEELDLILAAFRRISRPNDMNAQLHALKQPRSRLDHGIDLIATQLGWFYVCAIADDKFNAGFSAALNSEISNLKSESLFDRLNLDELKQLLITLKSRVQNGARSSFSSRAAVVYRAAHLEEQSGCDAINS